MHPKEEEREEPERAKQKKRERERELNSKVKIAKGNRPSHRDSGFGAKTNNAGKGKGTRYNGDDALAVQE